jgi:3-methyladenine DNA glycosylase AlkD
MLITINTICESNASHPITIDISDWDNWTIVDSPCIQQYGKMFGLMQPCAQNIKSNYYYAQTTLNNQIVKTIINEFKTKEQIINIFKQFSSIVEHDTTTLKSFVKKAIKKILEIETEANTIIYTIIRESNSHIQNVILQEITALKQQKKIQLGKEIDTTTQLIQYIESNHNNQHETKIKRLLSIIQKEQITIAAPIIFNKISEGEPLADEYIKTLIQLNKQIEDECRAYLQSQKNHLIEPALLILEKINPPDIVEIAVQFVDNLYTIRNVALRIINRQANEKHISLLLNTFKQSKDITTIYQITKTLRKFKTKEITDTFIQFIKENQKIDETCKHIVYATLISMNLQTYEDNPLKILEDFQPNAKEMTIILGAIQNNQWIPEEKTRSIHPQGWVPIETGWERYIPT